MPPAPFIRQKRIPPDCCLAAGCAIGIRRSEPSTGKSWRMCERNTSISSRMDSGSFDPLAWFCSSVHLLTCAASQGVFLQVSHMGLGEVFILADKHYGRNAEFLGLMLLKAISDKLRLADICARRAGQRITAGQNVNAGLAVSSRRSNSSSSVRGAAIALPVQLEISAVRKLFASPRGKKSLIVAERHNRLKGLTIN